MLYNMKYIRKFVKIDSFVNDDFDACADRFFSVINIVKINNDDVINDDVQYDDVLCDDV